MLLLDHFNSVLNHPSVITDDAISRLPQVPTNEALGDLPETQKVIRQLSSGKAPFQLGSIIFILGHDLSQTLSTDLGQVENMLEFCSVGSTAIALPFVEMYD